MSIRNWPGGIIRPVPVAPAGPYQDGAAPGVWTLDQVAFWQRQGLWPIAGNVNVRGLTAGGFQIPIAIINVIQYVTIATLGNAIDFGDLTVARWGLGACASSTRGVFAGGSGTNVIDYVTILTSGNAIDFGDLTRTATTRIEGCASSTRGVFGGGGTGGPGSSVMDYITIASTGNAINFGNLLYNTEGPSSFSSPTRGVFAAGYSNGVSPNDQANINYITIASTGNALNFGNLIQGRQGSAGCSNSTRGLIGGGYANPPASVFGIEFVTIASIGNGTNFGNLTVNRTDISSFSSQTRGVFSGGSSPGAPYYNIIDYVTIASTGNAIDFGDLLFENFTGASCSNGHGGL